MIRVCIAKQPAKPGGSAPSLVKPDGAALLAEAVKKLRLGPVARAITGAAGIELDTMKPLSTADVAKAAVAVLFDGNSQGVFDIHQIQRLADGGVSAGTPNR